MDKARADSLAGHQPPQALNQAPMTELDRFKSNSKLFKLMDDAGIQRMSAIAVTRRFSPGTTIIQEGEVGDTFYLITNGGVRVHIPAIEGEKEVARLGAGAFFGEMAVLNNEPRTASVTTIGDTLCLEFSKEPVLLILQDYPKVKEILGVIGLRRAENLLTKQMED